MQTQQTTFNLTDAVAIPAVGFGTYLVSSEDAPTVISTAIENGYRHVDTAEGYQNEAAVGEGLHAGMKATGLSRAEIFVTTKLWPGNEDWGNPVRTKQDTLEAFNGSLQKLGLDYVDLYLIHAPYGGRERLDQWRALLEIKAQGKARAVGVSNFSQAHLEEIRAAGLAMPDANQIELHPWSQKPELVGYMRRHGIAPIAYSSLVPLSTWRAAPGQDSAKSEAMQADGTDEASPFKAMARKYGVSEAQVLLRWGVQNGYAVLPKSLNPERMRQNLDLFSFAIDAPDISAIAEMDRGDGVAWAMGDPSKAV